MIEWKNSMDLATSKEIHIFVHNMRGFDGIFIVKEMYEMNLKVEKVLSTGQNTLYFKLPALHFKHSLSGLNMPLDEFTKTFYLQELKKG